MDLGHAVGIGFGAISMVFSLVAVLIAARAIREVRRQRERGER